VIREFVRNRLGSSASVDGKGAIEVQPPEHDGAIAVSDRRPANQLSLRELVAEDFATHGRSLAEPGFWAVAVHRLGERIEGIGPGLARRALGTGHTVLATAVDWGWGIKLPRTTRLGRRVRIWHNGSILLDAQSIGDDVQIRHDTTFGVAHGGDPALPRSRPVIEDGADIGSGACVLGANTVVLEPVPAGVRVLGVPARVIPDWIARKK
jgi:serine O-acetyltransferase